MSELTSRDNRAVLTLAELNALRSMVEAGDRSGFYLAYYGMTDSAEALLQAKIATFSGLTGGAAFAANRLLQDQYGARASGPYPGIYWLSQQVAESAYNAISVSADQAGGGTGLIDNATFFASAVEAWNEAGVLDLFPGNIYGPFGTDWSSLTTIGAVVAFQATAYAPNVGKTLAHYSSNQLMTLADGTVVAVDQNGHIEAVFATTSTDALIALGYAMHTDESSPNPPDPAILNNLLAGQTPASFTEINTTTYNGDVAPIFTNDDLEEIKYVARAAGSASSDFISAQGAADGGAADDLIIGGSAAQTLVGGDGDDIIWGRAGDDTINGGAGDDALRGGADDDTIAGGAGDDLIDGGDINLARSADGIDTVDYSGATGPVLLDFVTQDQTKVAQRIVTVANDGYGGKDQLHSIEKFILSQHADVIRVKTGANLDGIEEIDGRGGVDTLDLSASTASVAVLNLKILGSSTELKNIENIIGTKGADTFNFSQSNSLVGVIKVDAGSQGSGAVDTADFSQMSSGITLSTQGLASTGTRFDNFEKVVGTSYDDSISYWNGQSKIEVYGGGGADVIKTGGGDDLLDGGAGADQLDGGSGFDRYIVTNGDIIRDGDGIGSVSSSGDILKGGSRTASAGAFLGDGGDTYYWNGSGDLTIISRLGDVVTVKDFHNGQLGIQLKQVPKPDPFPQGPFKSPPMSPLVVDLDGDGIELSSTDGGVHFDFNGDNFRELTGWVNPDDGLLVYDVNGDGTIQNGQELFGSGTVNGFDVLSFYDGRTGGNYYSDPNGGTVNSLAVDGKIDANDSIFTHLQIWRDLNQDGLATANELSSLTDTGIESIGLDYTVPHNPDFHYPEIAGNQIRQVGSFQWANGGSGAVVDAWFSVDPSGSIYAGPSIAALDGWPDLRGYGPLQQLHVALANDAALKQDFREFILKIETQPISSLMPQFEELMYRWAGVGDDYDHDRGSFVDARKLAFLEHVFGQTFLQLSGTNEGTSSPGPSSAAVIESIFDTAVSSYFIKLLVQVPQFAQEVGGANGVAYTSKYSTLAEACDYDPRTDQLNIDLEKLVLDLSTTDMNDPDAVEHAIETFGLVSAIGAYLLQSNDQTFGQLRSIILSNPGAGHLLALIDSFRMYDSDESGQISSDNGLDLYKINAFHFANAGEYRVVEAGETIEFRVTADWTYSADIFYVKDGLGVVTFEREQGSSFYTTVQQKIVLSDEFSGKSYNVLHDATSGDVTLVFQGVGTTILLKNYLSQDAYAPFGSASWDTGSTTATHMYGQTIYFADGAVIYPTDIADLAIKATDGNDVLDGSFRLEQVIDGLDGDDIITGGIYDTVIGGEGDDQLSGVTRGTYIYHAGDGNDVISQTAEASLRLVGIDASQVVLQRLGVGGADLRVSFGSGSNDAVLVKDVFVGNVIREIVFDGGERWTMAYIRDQVVLQSASDGDDIIIGTDASEVLAGGRGNDTIQGAPGSFSAGDTFIYALGDGHDTIIPSYVYSQDTLKLVGIEVSAVEVSRDGDDALLTISGLQPGSLRIHGQFGSNGFYGLERIVFEDGTVWSQSDIVLKASDPILLPTVLGTEANDTIVGTSGADGLSGQAGNDSLNGGAGSDTYFYGVGDGNDIIEESGGTDDYHEADTVRLRVLPEDVEVTRTAFDVIIKIVATGETLTLKNFFFGDYTTDHRADASVECIIFDDGSTWSVGQIALNAWNRGTSESETITGTRDADTIMGGQGDDLLQGLMGDDTYVIRMGDGHDRINETDVSYGFDTIHFVDTTIDEVRFAKRYYGNERCLVIERLDGTASARINLSDGMIVEVVQFSDGTKMQMEEVLNQARYYGTAGIDEIQSFPDGLDAVIIGGTGDDTISGADGSDTYVWSRGDGNDSISDWYSDGADTLRLVGITPEFVRLERVAQPNGFDYPFYDLIIHILPRATTDVMETIRIHHQFDTNSQFFGNGIEYIEFGDGTIWNRAKFAAETPLLGTADDDMISGSEFADTIIGGLGDDEINGQGGSDTYIWSLGDGNDQINDRGVNDTDTLRLKNVNPADISMRIDTQFESPDLIIRIESTGEEIRLASQLRGGGRGIDQVVFDDGTVWDALYLSGGGGTSGDDVLVGNGQNNNLIGQWGDDTITGAGGDDAIDGGEGLDTAIYSGNRSDYVVTFNEATQEFAIEDLRPGGDGTDRVIGVELFSFADGVVHFMDLLWVIRNGTAEDDVLQGNGSYDVLLGFAGDDQLSGAGGDDVLVGGAGSDTMSGGDGNDRFDAELGDGDDAIDGGNGARDAVHYDDIATGVTVSLVTGTAMGVDIGIDTLLGVEDVYGGQGADVIVGGNVESILRGGNGDDLIFAGTQNSEFHGDAGIDHISFANAAGGVTVDLTISSRQVTVGAGENVITGFENLTGSDFNDRLRGNSGNNELTGRAGADTFVFGGAFGHDIVADFSSQDKLEFWESLFVDASAVLASASQVGANVVIDGGSKGSVTLIGVDLQDLSISDISVVPGAPTGEPIIKPEDTINVDMSSAVLIEAEAFSLAENNDIGASTSVPHASVFGTTSGQGYEYYAFSVSAGDHVTFDIDQGFDTVIQVIDVNGVVLAGDDDNDADPGSYTYNSYVEHTFANSGTYYLVVGSYDGSPTGEVPAQGQQYTLHISVESSGAAQNSAPTVTAEDLSLGLSSIIAAGSVFSVDDADGDAITGYQVYDATDAQNSAHWSVNGINQSALEYIDVSAEDLSSLTLVGGSVVGADEVWIRATDGSAWSEWHTLSAVTHA